MLHELTHPNVELLKATETSAETKPRRESSRSSSNKTILIKCKDCEQTFNSLNILKKHRDEAHPLLSHICMSCGQSFALAQALGRHSRSCQPSTSAAAAAAATAQVLSSAEMEHTEQEVSEASQLEGTTSNNKKSWKCNDCKFR